MIETRLTPPQLGLIAGTRGLLGAGIGLLLGGRLGKDQRKTVGWTLVLIGAASTIPLLLMAVRSAESDTGSDRTEPVTAPSSKPREPEPAAR
jgi:hypothetical protein